MTTLLTDLGGALLYFTLLAPIWHERPLTDSDLVPGPYPLAVPADQIAFAVQGFAYGDEDMRSRLVQSLGASQSAVARDALLDRLRRESVPSVLATVLLQLGNLPLDEPRLEGTIAPWISQPEEWRVRFAAVKTYAKLANANPHLLLKVAEEDANERIRIAALSALQERSEPLAFGQLSAFFEHENIALRNAAWQAALASRIADSDAARIAVAADGDVSLRHVVADGLDRLPAAMGIGLADKLSGDPHPSVRAAVAERLGHSEGGKARDILLALTNDEDYEVRRSACEALTAFPERVVVERLAKALGDRQAFVRQQAEESLVAIHDRQAVDEIVVEALASSDANARLHACNALGRVGVERHREAVAASVFAEERWENIVAALRALERLNYATSDAVALRFIEHETPAVRAAAAGVMGRLDSAAVDDALIALAADKANPVVESAIVSMGRLGKPIFSRTLLGILRDTGDTARYTGDHRARACWAAGHLSDLNRELANRLVEQATRPVIRTPMGPLFEADQVLASASFALAWQARRDPAYRQAFETVHTLHSRQMSPAEQMNLPPNALLPSAELLESARQAKAYLEGETVELALRPKRSMLFPYRSVKR